MRSYISLISLCIASLLIATSQAATPKPPAAAKPPTAVKPKPPAKPVPPTKLKIEDLVNRPDRWPELVTINKDFPFADGRTAKKGAQVHPLQFNGQQLIVGSDDNVGFAITPDDCDLLDAANKAWAKLSIPQRALDPATLEQDPSIWPERVKCFAAFRTDTGKELPAGKEYGFVLMTHDQVRLFDTDTNANLLIAIGQTDTIARAREMVLLPADKRPLRIANALRDIMVDADGKALTIDKLDDTKIFALYYGASWCPPCRQFSPEFVKFVNGAMPKNPKLVVVMMSNDKKDDDMLQYMKEEKMPWPAVAPTMLAKAPIFQGYQGNGIPQLVVVDRYGKVLANTFEEGQYTGPQKTVQTLSKLLDAGAAR